MKRIIALLVALSVAATTAHAEEHTTPALIPEKTPEKAPEKAPVEMVELMEQGTDLLKEEKLEEAGEVFLEALRKFPDQYFPALGVLKVSRVYQQRDESDRAISWIERAMDVAADPSMFHIALATIYIQQKSYEKGIGQVRKAVEASPESPIIIGNALSLYAAMNRFDEESRELGEQMLEKSPLDAHLFLGLWNQKNKEYEKARKHYLKAVMLNTNNIESRLMLGGLYEELGKFELAEREYIKVTTILPNHPSGYVALVELYKKTGQDELAKRFEDQLKRMKQAYDAQTQAAEETE